MSHTKLSPKQLKFCEEYIVDLNAPQAAIRAGYSKSYAVGHSHKMLDNVRIQNEISRLQEELRALATNEDIIGPKELLIGYAQDIRFDPGRLFKDDKKTLIPIPDLPKEIRMSLCGAKYDSKGQLEYKYPDKNKVRDSVRNMLGLPNGNAGLVKQLLEDANIIQVNVQGDLVIEHKTINVMEKAIERCG